MPFLSELTTIGIEHIDCFFKLYKDLIIKVKLYDTPGQERYRSINEKYFKIVDSIILIYDISNKRNFEECKEYYRDKIREQCKNNIKVILIGNKIDIEEREVTTEEGYAFAFENGYMFMETSCLTNDNIYDAFEAIIYETLLIKMKEEEEENKFNNKEKRILLQKNKNKQCIIL